MRIVRVLGALVGGYAIVALCAPAGALAAADPGPYFSAPFEVHKNSYTFGQAPTWTGDGRVLATGAGSGIAQVYSSRLDGSRRRCLTCGRLPGPTGFPAERRQGDWILFCSMGAAPVHFGAPCLGGYGSDLYAMRPGGRRITNLSAATDPAGGVPYDNYHPYWSPDGRQVVWTRVEANPLEEGGQRWTMMLADFVAPAHGSPRLVHARVVGPAFGVYETQAWAPDGSGFLFTAFGPRKSPFQARPPGWMHLGLYYMRLYGRGASLRRPRVTRISDNDLAYVEQAIFTPDMREVISMTNRARPAGWYTTVTGAARWLGYDAPYPGSVGGPMFLADFSDPGFTSDLWISDLRTGAVRQLTDFGHVIPEFGWNRAQTRLLWTERDTRADRAITRVARFAGISTAERRTPAAVPAPGLFGHPIRMKRVRDTPPPARTSTARVSPRPDDDPDVQSIPPVVGAYFLLFLEQLRDLGDRTGTAIPQPTLLAP